MPNMPWLRKQEWAGSFSGVKLFPPAEDTEITYEVLMTYYNQNGLYEDLMAKGFVLEQWIPAMKPFRNPANRSVEFFVSTLMPGVLPEALPIITDNEAIIEPIQAIWKWSNLNSKKPVAIRWLSVYGDLFIHPVVTENDEVYLQFIEPTIVTAWNEDDRENVTAIRLDMARPDNKTYTEFWTDERYAKWLHSMGNTAELDQLGEPYDSGTTEELGIDFCPFVHVKFKDTGEKRGVGSFGQCLDKIDEANRMATRLHQMLFRYNKPLFVLMSNMVDEDGVAVPPLGISEDALTTEDDQLLRIGGKGELESLIPDIRYMDALSILQDLMSEIEKDLPELAVVKLREKGDLSGRAVRLFLTDATARAEEARSNFETGLIRSEIMALQRGNSEGIFTVSGELEHVFKVRPIFETTLTEKTANLVNFTKAGFQGLEALQLAGFDDDEIPESVKKAETDPEVGTIEEVEEMTEELDNASPIG